MKGLNSHRGFLFNDLCGTFKVHRVTEQTGSVANTWTDCTNFSLAETQGEVAELNADGKTIDIKQDGLYVFGGCLHLINTSQGTLADMLALSRIWKNGTEEARCSQRGFNTTLVANGGEDVLSYNGTVDLRKGDSIVLQYFTDNVNLSFFSNVNFQERVAYTLWLVWCGELKT